eukprot:TRINITY_DN2153_c0_g1_i2.p1 TRINITY_DN2153_c0_g1~~TRINITY_DN2153_c0_g1_i2.p1  ORF type:complete len:1989 (+),score=648.15 TRINITY_DN2153_c0_g1_i2:67-6033(+)
MQQFPRNQWPDRNSLSYQPRFWVNNEIRTDNKRKKQICAVIGIPEIDDKFQLCASLHLTPGEPTSLHQIQSIQSIEYVSNHSSANIVHILFLLWPPDGRQWRNTFELRQCLAIEKMSLLETPINQNFKKKTDGVFDDFSYPLIACHFEVEPQFRPSYTLGKPAPPDYLCKVVAIVKYPNDNKSHFFPSEVMRWAYWNGATQKMEPLLSGYQTNTHGSSSFASGSFAVGTDNKMTPVSSPPGNSGMNSSSPSPTMSPNYPYDTTSSNTSGFSRSASNSPAPMVSMSPPPSNSSNMSPRGAGAVGSSLQNNGNSNQTVNGNNNINNNINSNNGNNNNNNTTTISNTTGYPPSSNSVVSGTSMNHGTSTSTSHNNGATVNGVNNNANNVNGANGFINGGSSSSSGGMMGTNQIASQKFVGARKRKIEPNNPAQFNGLEIEEVVPSSGPALCENIVTVWGRGFTGPEWFGQYGVKVFFGEMEGYVERINESYSCIKCRTPPCDPGKVHVTVQTGQRPLSPPKKLRAPSINGSVQFSQLQDGYEFYEIVLPTIKPPPQIEIYDTFKQPFSEGFGSDNFGFVFDGSNSTSESSSSMSYNSEFSMMFSAYMGDFNRIVQLLNNQQQQDHKSLVNVRDDNGATPLFWAVWSLHYDVAQLLVNSNADVNMPNHCGESPLHIACDFGDLDMVEFLVKHSADVNSKNIDGETPLFYGSHHQSVVNFLLQSGAKDTTKNRNGKTYNNWFKESSSSSSEEFYYEDDSLNLPPPTTLQPSSLVEFNTNQVKPQKSNSATSQVVRQVIDTLSDAVSELVLLVVVLAEQNAQMPPQLPTAAANVNSTADMLANLARKLSRTEYSEFPAICKDIEVASDAVNNATAAMAKAITILAGSSDRKQGWNGLVDACRIMSAKTIELLQLIYGVALKCLHLTADHAIENINNQLNTSIDLSNPVNRDRFTQMLQSVLKESIQLANYVCEKGDQEDSPYAKGILRNASRRVRDRARDVQNVANIALRDPNVIPHLEDCLWNLKNEIASAKQRVRETTPDVLNLTSTSADAEYLPLLEKALKTVQRVSSQGKLDVKIDDKEDEHELTEEESSENLDKVKDDVNDLIKKMKRRDARTLKRKLTASLSALNEKEVVSTPLTPPATSPSPTQQPQKKWVLGRGRERKACDDLLLTLESIKRCSVPKIITKEVKDEVKGIMKTIRSTLSQPELLSIYKQQQQYEEFKDNLIQLKQAVIDEEPNLANKHLRMAAKKTRDLIEEMRFPLNNTVPTQIQKMMDDSANDLQISLPQLIKMGVTAIKQDLKNESTKKDLLMSIQRIVQAADRGNKAKVERDLRDNWDHFMRNARKSQHETSQKNKKGLEESLKNMSTALHQIQRAVSRCIERRGEQPHAFEQSLQVLENLYEEFKSTAEEAIRTQTTPALNNKMEQVISNMEVEWKKFDSLVLISAVAPIQDVEDAVEGLVGAIFNQKIVDISGSTKKLMERIKVLSVHCEQFTDSRIRQVGTLVVDRMNKGVKELLSLAKQITNSSKASKDSHSSSSDTLQQLRQHVSEVYATSDKLKHSLSQLKRAVSPPRSSRREASLSGTGVKVAANELVNVLSSSSGEKKNSENVKNSSVKLKDELSTFNNHVARLSLDRNSTSRRSLMEKEIDTSTQLLAEIVRSDGDVDIDTLDQICENVDKMTNYIQNDIVDDYIATSAKVNNVFLMLESVKPDEEVDTGLLETAGMLSNLLIGLAKDMNKSSYVLQGSLKFSNEKLSIASTAISSFDKIVSDISFESPVSSPLGIARKLTKLSQDKRKASVASSSTSSSSTSSTSSTTTTSSTVNSSGSSQSNASSSNTIDLPDLLDSAQNFSDVAAAVAGLIKLQTESVSKYKDSIVSALEEFSQASKNGLKQKMILSARDLSSHITKYCSELTEIARNMPSKNPHSLRIQDRLYLCSQALKDFSIQLKILVAVKAASLDDVNDSDETLGTLIKNLGGVVSQSLDIISQSN